MEKEELIALINRYRAGEASPAEKALVENWYLSLYDGKPMEVSLSERLYDLKIVKTNLNEEFVFELGNKKQWIRSWRYTAVAASLFFMLSLGILYYHKPAAEISTTYTSTEKNDILPGTSKAVLTLANGEKIFLSDNENMEVARLKATHIFKTTAGAIKYISTDQHSSTPEHNTLETPKGGKYMVCLPDGSKVWLNAASSLTYPTSFSSLRERQVQLSGEAYFEITPDKTHPFRVKTTSQEVEVLGTHFNINSYAEEKTVKTTLIEGRIDINHQLILRPGEQAQNSGKSIVVKTVDTDAAIDWTNNDFIFTKGEDLKSAMRKIERWYDVEIIYETSVPATMELGGWISRENKLSDVLERVEITGKVHFKIKGRRIIVTNQ